MNKESLRKISKKMKELTDATPKITDKIFDKSEEIIEKLKGQKADEYLSVMDPNSLYYYKGRNVAKNIGKLLLKADFHLFVMSGDKKTLKPIIEANKKLNQQSEEEFYFDLPPYDYENEDQE